MAEKPSATVSSAIDAPVALGATATGERLYDRVRRQRFSVSLALNIFALGALYVAYSTIRTLTADSFTEARSNADWLVSFQDSLGLPSEATVQSLLLDYEWLVRGANFYYLTMHFPSMIVFLLATLIWHRQWMPRVRLALIGSTVAGLVIHLAFPLAPPRMLSFGGFVDTAKAFGPDPYALGIAKAANEIAAMPSMHVGWALLIAVAVVRMSSSRWRWIVVAHPVITTAVVVVTANHYWSDVLVGALLGCAGWWATRFADPERRAGFPDTTGVDAATAAAAIEAGRTARGIELDAHGEPVIDLREPATH